MLRSRGKVIECLGVVFRRVDQEMPGVLSFQPTNFKVRRQRMQTDLPCLLERCGWQLARR